MSDLREQLESMKRDYHSARYPGNLAAELLAPAKRESRPMMRIVGWSATITGIAAAIVVWIAVHPHDTSPRGSEVAVNQTTPAVPILPKISSTPGQSIAPPRVVPEEPTAVADASSSTTDTVEVESFSEMGTTPAFPQDVPIAPSATEIAIPSTFTFPSMDMTFTDTSDSSKEST